MTNNSGIVTAVIGSLFIGGVILSEMIPKKSKKEKYGNVGYQPTRQFYGSANVPQNTERRYANIDGNSPEREVNVNLQNSGSQLLSYQIYQQAVNAATPTVAQLDAISGQSWQQTGRDAREFGGGLASNTAPYAMLRDPKGPSMFASEFQAVNIGSERAQSISACAQNAPTFVATSLLPKPVIPGMDAWTIDAPNDVLANQNFLSATQQIGVDTVMGSNRNQSRDIRNNIPAPINVVSPWNNTAMLPDLEKRPLDCYVPSGGIYGCAGGPNVQGTYVGQ